MRGAFATRPGSQVDNLRVLLVDDVMTTGATLDSCAKALREAGAKSVVGLTVARAVLKNAAEHLQVRIVPEGSAMSARRPSWSIPGGAIPPKQPERLCPAQRVPPAVDIPSPITARRMALMQEPVLVLNATYEPINVTAVRRAMVLMLKGVAQAEELHNAEVHSAAHAHRVPSVIRLLAYRHIPQQSRALSRKNILLRDRNTCQFCGRIFPSSELTLDHVVPRSQGRAVIVGESGGVLLPLQ